MARNAEEAGITFCFAQVFHPSFRHTAVARRELGIPTAFNFLGPLTNPAHVQASAVGVANARMAPLVAGVLAKRGSRGLVFRGNDGLDELTTTGPSTVWEIRDGDGHRARPSIRASWASAGQLWRNCAAATPRRTPPSSVMSLPAPRARHATPSLLNAAAGLVAFDLDAGGPLPSACGGAEARRRID